MSNQEQERIQLIGRVSAQADKVWLDAYRELLASFSLEDVQKAMYAYVRLNAQEVREQEPDLQFYLLLLERTFVTLYDRGAIIPAAPITSLGQKALDQMRISTGIGVEALEPEAPVLTAEQRLEEEVKLDWHNLPSAKIKAKMNASKSYRAMFEKLSATDAIASQATLHSVIGG